MQALRNMEAQTAAIKILSNLLLNVHYHRYPTIQYSKVLGPNFQSLAVFYSGIDHHTPPLIVISFQQNLDGAKTSFRLRRDGRSP